MMLYVDFERFVVGVVVVVVELDWYLCLFLQYQTDDFGEASNREERRIERMIRKTGRDIYRLRKTKTTGVGGRPPGDIISFKWVPKS